MQLHWVDATILIITAVSCIFGLWRGFVREVLSLLAWIAALLIARVYSEAFAPALSSWIASAAMQQIFAFALLFIATLLVGALINHLVAKLIAVSGLKLTDRLLGAVFGVARGVVIVMVFVYFGGSFFATEPWWSQSQLIPYGEHLVEMSKMFVLEESAPVS
ncbi:MAG: CvpA family protein [Pseudohongiellaceae bacterium]|nr:CvpA family protein [Pseudohongiellaceae bacterium]